MQIILKGIKNLAFFSVLLFSVIAYSNAYGATQAVQLLGEVTGAG